jgi:hypothetical protein
VFASLLWLGGWWGDDCGLPMIVAPWNMPGNTTQLVPADHMNVATRARSHANAVLIRRSWLRPRSRCGWLVGAPST